NASRPLDGVVIPHLFANGKFKAKYNNKIFTIDGIWGEDYILVDYTETGDAIDRYIAINECKLIARPINDMSDEELIAFNNEEGTELYDERRLDLMSHVESYCYGCTLDDTVSTHLLEIGIYPFNQQDFEEDWLIDAGAV